MRAIPPQLLGIQAAPSSGQREQNEAIANARELRRMDCDALPLAVSERASVPGLNC